MANRTVLGTYSTLEQARQVVDELQNEGFDRANVGVAVHHSGEEILVTVTASEERLSAAEGILRDYLPIQFDTRKTGWREDGSHEQRMPDVDQYEAVELADKRGHSPA